MKRLGAILAGGLSSRFGSDKALALSEGRSLIGHVADALLAQCSEIVVCGRNWGDLPSLLDQPVPGLGPMGGLCAALLHAENLGYAEVLAAPCDLLGIPADAAQRLAPAPAVADGQWLIGLWPAALAPRLRLILEQEGAVSARRWLQASGAVARPIVGLRNINRADQLEG